ncbi:MAG: hypothetical protein J7L14_01645, partial [Candidatus Diapherotrites archaeon]|nr:hypothetical protein [Candidatus Diapherotrites archaeon]
VENTAEIERVKILNTVKIQDGLIRINYVAGKAAEKQLSEKENTIRELCNLLGVEKEQLLARCKELFEKWKKARKAVKKGKQIELSEIELSSKEQLTKEELSVEALLHNIATVLKTQEQYLLNTVKRFLKELEEFKEKIAKLK